jgi:hypothetical protein
LVEKFESRIIRLGEYLRIAIPPEISAETDLVDQTPVDVFVNEKGNIEIEVQSSGQTTNMCSICTHYAASKKCINCGRHVCLKCFWNFGSLCKKCAKRL